MGATPTEIRIHGVSGTPPQDMLGVGGPTDVERVASYVDPRTGFYQARRAATEPIPDVDVEAYSWGSLTSGGVGFVEPIKRAAWLVLLPFALANVAYWVRTDIDHERRARPAASRVRTAVAIRWAGLLLTMAFISAACLVSIDLVAWQCFRGGGRVCAFPDRLASLDVLGFLGEPAWNSLGRRVAVTALFPTAVLVGIRLLSFQAKTRYEAVPDEPSSSQIDVDGQSTLDGATPILRRTRMWQGSQRLALQQVLHMDVGLAVIVLSGAVPLVIALQPVDQTAQARWWLLAASALAGLALLVAFAGAGFSVRDGVEFDGPNPRLFWARRCAWGSRLLVLLAVGAFVIPAVWLLDARDFDESRSMAGSSLLIGLVFLGLLLIVSWLVFADRSWRLALLAACSVAVLALLPTVTDRADRWVAVSVGVAAVMTIFLVGWRLHRRTRAPGNAWGGAAAAMTLGAATWVAMIFTVVLGVGFASLLNGDESVTDLESTFDPERSAGQAAIDLGPDASEAEALTAEKPVTVRNAVFYRAAATAEWTVLRGEIETPSLTATFGDGSIEKGVPDVTVSSGQLTLKEPRITLVDSCRADDARSAAVMTARPGCPVAGIPTTRGSFIHRGAQSTGLTLGLGSANATAASAAQVHIAVTEHPQELLVLPSVLLWVTSLLPFWVAAVVLTTVAASVRFRHRARAPIRIAARADEIHLADLPRCTRRRERAALVHRLERLTSLFATATVLVLLVLVVGSATGEAPWARFDVLRRLGDLGLLFAIAVAGGIVWFASRVRKDEAGRRQAGILWDLTTFWPRMAHPFGPPCYAERVVPEVTRRIRATVDQTSLVILSGHSMGSVIAVAVATRLSDAELARIRLITYGSQLSAWFGRIFPAVLGPDLVGTVRLERAWDFANASPDAPTTHGVTPRAAPLSLRGRLGPGNWVNVFRRTDPLGFRLFSESDSAEDRYVCELDERHDLNTHGGYPFTPEYEAVVETWVRAGSP